MHDLLFSSDEAERGFLSRVQVRLVSCESEQTQWNAHLEQKHYLKSSRLVGEQLRYVAEVEGQWVALLGWSAGQLSLATPRGLDWLE